MSRLSIFVLIILFCALAVGCSPFRALIYTGVTEPGAVGGTQMGLFSMYGANGDTPRASYEVDNSKGPGPKLGTGTVINILGLVAFGDASVEGAAKRGNLKTINTIDGTYHNVLFLFSSWTTRVTGE